MKNEMYANLLTEIRRLNAKVDEMMNNDDDDDDDECYDDTSADLERIGDELKELGKLVCEIYNSDDFGGIPKAIDVNAAEVQNVSEKVERGCYDIAESVDLACGYLEKISDLYEERLMREKNEFISLNIQNPKDESIVPTNVKISAISLILDIPNEEGVSEIMMSGFGNNFAIRVFHTSDEILELIRKAKRTDYEVYKETLAENCVTEDEILCYVAHQSSGLVAPYMNMEQTMSYIDEVKKAKAEGFDFSIEHLEERRKAREEEIMKKGKGDNE